VYIFSVNPHLGPLQVSLSRMVMDIMKFFFLYVLVLFAFSCGKFNDKTEIDFFHFYVRLVPHQRVASACSDSFCRSEPAPVVLRQGREEEMSDREPQPDSD
jgi:hypothetical protein